MNRHTVMNKDRLAAFVDGEMSPEDAASVVMHLADHPADQAYVDDLMAANAALAQAFAGPMEEPVPPALRDLILAPSVSEQQGNVLTFAAKPRSAARAAWGGMAVGAALAAAVALIAFRPAAGVPDLAPGPLAAGSPLDRVLAQLPAGEVQTQEDGSEVMILTTVPTPDGFCREVEVIRPAEQSLKVALACTEGTGWTVEVVIAENLADAAGTDGFGTASGDEAQSFAPFLDRIGAGGVLDPEDEAAVIARGWAK